MALAIAIGIGAAGTTWRASCCGAEAWITLEQAKAELRVLGERAAATLPATHAHLRPFVARLGQDSETPPGIVGLGLMYLPSLLVLLLACTTVGTLFYARTAIREGEMAMRSRLVRAARESSVRSSCRRPYSRGVCAWLFVEALVLASIAAAVGLIAADRTLRWGIESVAEGEDLKEQHAHDQIMINFAM